MKPAAETAASRVHVAVPASAANVGPGYDSFGLALAKYDDIWAERRPDGLEIDVAGVGEDTVPRSADHLVAVAARRAFDAMGEDMPGLALRCVNRIPHGGGQGSSAAAIVAGILVARALTAGGSARLTDDDVFALATEMEGHPDNVAPALYGGFTIAWSDSGGGRPRAVRLTPHPRVKAVTFTAEASLSTATARAALPAQVPHADAAANSARAALMAYAITAEPGLLFDATEDYLHQRYRAGVMPASAALIARLRAAGAAAVLSGAGPSVLVLCCDNDDVAGVLEPGFRTETVAVPTGGARVDGVPFGAGAARGRDDVAPAGPAPVV